MPPKKAPAPKKATEAEAGNPLLGKSEHTLALYDHFIKQYQKIAPVTIHPAKTMVGIATERKRVCYVTQFGKDFLHAVFIFEEPHPDNLCFQKIAHVPEQKQYNHHFRMYAKEDVNAEVKSFMKLAYEKGK